MGCRMWSGVQALAALGCTRLWLVLLVAREAFASVSAVAPAARARDRPCLTIAALPLRAGATAAAERAASSIVHRAKLRLRLNYNY